MKHLPKRYLIVALTFLCTCVCYIERVGFPIAYTAAAERAGINQSSKGLILSTFYYGYAVSQVPGGWASLRLGGRRVLLFSFILWSLTSAFVPPNPKLVKTLVLARLLVGVAQGFIFPSIHTVLAQWVPPHERSRSVSLTTSGMYFGAATGMLFLPSLVQLWGPRAVFVAEGMIGGLWALLWFRFSSDPPRSDHAKASATGFGESTSYGSRANLLPLSVEKEHDNGNFSDGIYRKKVESATATGRVLKIPWKRIMISLPIWAIIVNNFTFHYALYVLMNWLPTYFEKGLQLSLQKMGSSKMIPYLNMFIFSNIGGVIADRLITGKILSISNTRKMLNTVGFFVAAFALAMMPSLNSSGGAIFCSSVCLGFLALGRAGFAVNHLDVAPRYAGIVLGISNTAGTLAGIVGVGLTGQILESAKAANLDLSSPSSWTWVFGIPALLCLFSSLIFLLFATGDRIFD